MSQNQDISQMLKNMSLVYDGEAIPLSKFGDWLRNKHGDKDLDYWRNLKVATFKKLAETKMSYLDLPKDEQEEFYEAVKIDGCIQQLASEIEMMASEKGMFYQYYAECTKPEFLQAKKALLDNLPMLVNKHKQKVALKTIFFTIPELKSYFSSFIFDMKNKHSGKYEMVIGKKIHFPTTVDELESGAIFRFMDSVADAFKKVRYDKDNKIENSEEVIRSVFLPQIWNGCGYCEDPNYMTFNHKEGTVVEIEDKKCSLSQKDVTKQKSKISTKGKLIFCNDVRDFSPNDTMSDEIYDLGRKHKFSTYLNTWEGQNGFMNAYAQLFNVAYFTAGNHGANLQKTKKGLKITYHDNEGKSLQDISLSLWAASLIDYDEAVKIAGSEKNLLDVLSEMEHCIVEVKPGTYEAIRDCSASEDRAYGFKKKDLAFGELVWLNGETELAPFTEEDWETLR